MTTITVQEFTVMELRALWSILALGLACIALSIYLRRKL